MPRGQSSRADQCEIDLAASQCVASSTRRAWHEGDAGVRLGVGEGIEQTAQQYQASWGADHSYGAGLSMRDLNGGALRRAPGL